MVMLILDIQGRADYAFVSTSRRKLTVIHNVDMLGDCKLLCALGAIIYYILLLSVSPNKYI